LVVQEAENGGYVRDFAAEVLRAAELASRTETEAGQRRLGRQPG
jgi:hypothetical protein